MDVVSLLDSLYIVYKLMAGDSLYYIIFRVRSLVGFFFRRSLWERIGTGCLSGALEGGNLIGLLYIFIFVEDDFGEQKDLGGGENDRRSKKKDMLMHE